MKDSREWKGQEFKWLTGVKHETFRKMVAVLNWELSSFGRPSKLSRTDQLLMTLMYWREYRTQFHIAGLYGISEATVFRTINKVEDALVRSGEFRLPGKKVLQPSDTIIEVILVDVSEQPIERPKKAKTTLQWQKEAPHTESTGDHSPAKHADHRHSFWKWQHPWFSPVQREQDCHGLPGALSGRCRLSGFSGLPHQ